MEWGTARRAGRAPGGGVNRLRFSMIAAGLLALCGAACTTDRQPTSAIASSRGATVAFESIDGPPESIFNKLVQSLSVEADARQVAVVSREAAPHYRIRAYVANLVHNKRSVIAWVWDVYDADQRRITRITGQEPIIGAGRTTWAAASDDVLQRIARNGMERLTVFLGSPVREPSLPPPPPAQDQGVTVASADGV